MFEEIRLRACTINKHRANISFVGCAVIVGPQEGERFTAFAPDGVVSIVECQVVRNLNAPRVDYLYDDPSTWDSPGLMWQDDTGENWGLIWD